MSLYSHLEPSIVHNCSSNTYSLVVEGFCLVGAGSHTVKVNVGNCYQTGQALGNAHTGRFIPGKLMIEEVHIGNSVENGMVFMC